MKYQLYKGRDTYFMTGISAFFYAITDYAAILYKEYPFIFLSNKFLPILKSKKYFWTY